MVSGKDTDTLGLITPSVVQLGDRITFSVTRTEGSTVEKDSIDVVLSPCEAGADDIFVDCVAPGFGALRAYERLDQDGTVEEGFHFKNSGDRHLVWRLVDTGEPGYDT